MFVRTLRSKDLGEITVVCHEDFSGTATIRWEGNSVEIPAAVLTVAASEIFSDLDDVVQKLKGLCRQGVWRTE